MRTLAELILRSSGKSSCKTNAPPALVRELERLEDRLVMSTVVQTVTVKDTAGHLLSGVSVAVTDSVSTKAPLLTNNNGQVSFTVNNGIQSILAFKDGFADKLLAINLSASNYTLVLSPLTSSISTASSSVSGKDVK